MSKTFTALVKGAYQGKGKRTGTPGHYVYNYDEPKDRGKAKKKTIPLGQCFPFANKLASQWTKDHVDVSKRGKDRLHPDLDNKEKFKVVHGKLTDLTNGEVVEDHAWVVKEVRGKKRIFDSQTSFTRPEGIPEADFKKLYRLEPKAEYTAEDVMLNCVRSGQHGPWG